MALTLPSLDSSCFIVNPAPKMRVAFEAGLLNPRATLGKYGIRAYACNEGFFKEKICITAFLRDTNKEEMLRLSKRSALAWINAHYPLNERLSSHATDKEIIDKINKLFHDGVDWNRADIRSLHANIVSRRPLNATKDYFHGLYVSFFWKTILSSWHLFRLRFTLFHDEARLFYHAQARACDAFWRSLRSVPAYRTHINTQTMPIAFNEIAPTNKENYIKPYSESADIKQTLVGAHLPFNGQVDTSTGTTGKPTMWIRGPEELKTIKTLINYATKVVMGDRPLFFINSFAMGQWATGLTTSKSVVDRAITFSPGTDKDKIFDILALFPPGNYPDREYIIAGSPPFLKEFVEEARRRGVDLDTYKISGVVGGEAMSEAARQIILGLDEHNKKVHPGFIHVLSSYGASDLDINIGYESEFEIELRQACINNPHFACELYGAGEPVPNIFHYDPMNYFIEVNENQELLFTCVRGDRVSPRIRYNLKDRGKVMPVSEVMALCKKYRIEIGQPNTHLPLLFVWGREGTVNYRGAKVPADHLHEACQQVSALKDKVKYYAFNNKDEHGVKKLEIWLEFKEGAEASIDVNTFDDLQRSLLQVLSDVNDDFRFQLENAPRDQHPALIVFEPGTSPMSNQDPHRKRKYLFDNGK